MATRMSSQKKPIPRIVETPTAICPVCGERSYSHGGIHPQCAVRRSDAPRQERLRAEKKSKAQPAQRRLWAKKCPKCGAELHVRKKLCACGHDFTAAVTTRAARQGRA
jgi:predicted nucleic-acid-binding Zn-ribbon protein